MAKVDQGEKLSFRKEIGEIYLEIKFVVDRFNEEETSDECSF